MYGISLSGKKEIHRIVEETFDRLAMQLIGEIPRLKNKKILLLSSKPNFNLAHLFIQSMANKTPNPVERDALKGMLESSLGWIDSLKNKTRSSITEKLDSYIKESKAQNRDISEDQIEQLIEQEMSSARNSFNNIVEAESSKIKGASQILEISHVASDIGDSDPNVAFLVIRDSVTCKECIRLHLMPDGITPRVWRLSELSHGYHKRGENKPSIAGLHPNCRCTLIYISKGFGYDKQGKLKFVDLNHDEYLAQRRE
jgi:hypothetical protein